jgi:uncharacterized repeat protein (TIGR01451 family)
VSPTLTTLATDGPAPAVTDEDDHDDAIVSGAVHYDLALIKTVNTTSVVEGGQVTWTITVRNQGNVSSGLYTVTDTIPGGMSYDSSSPTGSHAAGVVTWANQLQPGARRGGHVHSSPPRPTTCRRSRSATGRRSPPTVRMATT